jgi:hypothetical protein
MATVRVIGGDKLRRQLARLSQESEKTVKNGIARLGVAVRDDIAEEVGKSFEFSNSSTRNFLVKAWKYKYGDTSDGLFTVLIYPLEKAAQILKRHVARQRITAADKADVVVDGKIAIPIAGGPIKRDGRGRIPAKWSPKRLLKRDRRGRSQAVVSESGNVILAVGDLFQMTPAFALKDATETEKRFDPQEIAEQTIKRSAGKMFGLAIREAMRRSGMKG